MKLFWFIPTHGDGRYLGTSEAGRALDLTYLQQVAAAIDRLGFYGALLPTGRSCEDAWVAASFLAATTHRMRFLVAVRPGLISPTLAARMAATFDRLSGGRLLINVVSHLTVRGAKVLYPALQQPYPALYCGGSSDAAIAVAAKHVDHYLPWGEPPAQVAEKIARTRQAAAGKGRELRFGIRLHLIVRETEAEAWQDAEKLISRLNDQTVTAAQKLIARHDSAGQQRMIALQKLNGGNRTRAALEISPNLWFIFSGYPHLEEAYRAAELLFPRLPLQHEISNPHDGDPQRAETVIKGEMVANELLPSRTFP